MTEPVLSPDGEHVYVNGSWIPWDEWPGADAYLVAQKAKSAPPSSAIRSGGPSRAQATVLLAGVLLLAALTIVGLIPSSIGKRSNGLPGLSCGAAYHPTDYAAGIRLYSPRPIAINGKTLPVEPGIEEIAASWRAAYARCKAKTDTERNWLLGGSALVLIGTVGAFFVLSTGKPKVG